MRAVVSPEVWESQAFHARTRELRLRMDDSNLLVERHAAQRIVNTLLHRYGLIEICLRHAE